MRIFTYLTILAVLAYPASIFAQTEKIFKTNHAAIYYKEDKDLSDFLWRISGQRLEPLLDDNFAKTRVDRIVERVETILDMRPKNFHIDIYLHREELTLNRVAYYEHKTKSIHAAVDNVSDGVFAHEIAHAVISQYFSSPPPSKAQEILTQYVDKYLWSDY